MTDLRGEWWRGAQPTSLAELGVGGIRLLILSKECKSLDEIEALRPLMPSAEGFTHFVVWDTDRPLDLAILTLKGILTREGINVYGGPPKCDSPPEPTPEAQSERA